MRKAILILAVLLIAALTVAFYPSPVEKPEINGTGKMAVRIEARYTAPEYHSPTDWWQAHHPDMVNRGDLFQQDCLYCHEPEKSCNNCHNYVGANPIVP